MLSASSLTLSSSTSSSDLSLLSDDSRDDSSCRGDRKELCQRGREMGPRQAETRVSEHTAEGGGGVPTHTIYEIDRDTAIDRYEDMYSGIDMCGTWLRMVTRCTMSRSSRLTTPHSTHIHTQVRIRDI